MQITKNTTSMAADLSVAVDKEGRDHCVVVVKGTFSVDKDGTSTLAEEQEPIVYADVHYDDPGTTSIKYESDFAAYKPRTDIIVNGYAYSPDGQPVKEVLVTLEIEGSKKYIKITGDRYWEKKFVRMVPSYPKPFVKMPIVFERAFGGSDNTHPNIKKQGTELRNPVGAGFHKNADPKTIEGKPLPNIEDPTKLMRRWSDIVPPVGFGFIGRGWKPRINHAGTYDEKWKEEKFPFLPDDFDYQYFQSSPPDQQVPFLQGGETIRCTNMTPEGTFVVIVPILEVPLLYRFRDREVKVKPNLDTLIIEPDNKRILLIWRGTVPVGRKLTALREILIGRQTVTKAKRPASEKPHIRLTADFVDWNNR